MADIPPLGLLKHILLESNGETWDEEDIRVCIGESGVAEYTITRFLQFLRSNPLPDDEVYYANGERPEVLHKIDVATVVAKLIRFVDGIDASKCQDEWGSALLREDLGNLGSAVVRLLEIYHRERYRRKSERFDSERVAAPEAAAPQNV
jgi:hypothetical protein